MRKFLFIVIPPLIAILIFIAVTIILNKTSNKGGLQVTSVPKSKVYLDGKLIGETPLCKCDQNNMITTGEYTIKLVPSQENFSYFEGKITVSSGTLTVVDRSFGQGGLSQGSIINLIPIDDKKDAQVSIISFPDKAKVFLDNNLSGTSPLLLRNITESDHEVKLSKDGYKEKAIRIRIVAGYKLESIIFLSINQDVGASSAAISVPLSISPTPTVKNVIILNTPTGFLRVRESNSISSAQVALVNPRESYELISEQESWYEIKLKDGKTGWISSQYAKKETP